jgi:NAD(P)H-dependent flavin oxidoreductase YrpB (nitropropane dioxygenase family)
MTHPKIIQGGMGVAVSGWKLAGRISELGQLGVVSGTGLSIVLARGLQAGDPTGKLRHALRHFPVPGVADRIVEKYFIEGGKASGETYKVMPMPTLQPEPAAVELIVAANFVEVFLAKEGHAGVVGINYLEKIQLPTLPSLFGAMLAGVDYVLMGAGIPRSIPGVLDALARGEPVRLKIDIAGPLLGEEFFSEFDPRKFCAGSVPVLSSLTRPFFLGIVASATLAMTLAKKASGPMDGFVVEGPLAGGHNAPPRGVLQLSTSGEPVYGERDVVDLEKIRDLGLPFWLAGACGQAGKLHEALRLGASGIQVGTAFAFCAESGIQPALKQRAIALSRAGRASVFTDPVASPTGFPFKVLQMSGTLSGAAEYSARERICDLGFLRQVYRRPDGTVGYRCAAEPVSDYLRKGGTLAETEGRKCLCNGLAANVGLGQQRPDGTEELALLTAGDEVANIAQFLPPGGDSYTAADVLQRLLAAPAPVAPDRSEPGCPEPVSQVG